MSADKRAQRLAEHERWLKLHGRRCLVCGCELDDEDLLEGVDPRQPRTCIDCCGTDAVVEL